MLGGQGQSFALALGGSSESAEPIVKWIAEGRNGFWGQDLSSPVLTVCIEEWRLP